MTNEIKLIEVMSGLEQRTFERKYPGRRRKLRFNTSFKGANAVSLEFGDFLAMYKSQSKDLEPCMLSLGDADKRKRLKENDTVFEFIEVDSHKWIFVGAYEVIDFSKSHHNPLKNEKFIYAKARRVPEFEPFRDRLLVNFTNKQKNFYYVNADIIDSVVIDSILDEPYLMRADDFPGYEHVCRDFASLLRCINKTEWKTALSSVFGVYVLTDIKTGKLYVGSATGQNGIYGRWSEYLNKGYDDSDKDYPNKQLKKLVKSKGFDYIKANFQYSILETFPKTDIGRDRALARERYWKTVFRTRAFGYNDN